jgi:quercetin dioxygenase-like cupin family protein
MLTANLESVQTFPAFPDVAVGFPLSSNEGTAAIATVWIELAPGGEVASHTDSAEELLVVIEGEIEATVDGETGTLGERQLAIVPPLAPHGLRNVSDRPARVLGVFASSTVVSLFNGTLGPDGASVAVIGAPMPVLLPLATA